MKNRIISIIILWVTVLSVNAQSSESLIRILEESIQANDWERIYNTAQLLIKKYPNNINGYLFSAEYWEHQGKVDSAIFYYRQIPLEFQDYLKIAELYETVGNTELQLISLDSAVRYERYKTPLDVQSLYEAGIVDNPDTLIRVKSFNISLKERADLYSKLHLFDKAANDYRLIVEDGEVQYNIELAEMLVKDNRYNEAAECLALISDKNYGYKQELLNWFCNEKLGMFEEDMSKIENNPEYAKKPEFYIYRAELYLQLGNEIAACKDYEIAKSLGAAIVESKLNCTHE